MNALSPLIGIPCRHDISHGFFKERINAQSEAYLTAITRAGGIPLLMPVGLERPALRRLYDLSAGILLTGGGDIDPALYRRPPHPKVTGIQTDRDRDEIALSQWAAEEPKPLLGICRGIQVMAVAGGGTLWQDLPTERPEARLHNYTYCDEGSNEWDYLAHQVELTPSCRLSRALQTDKFRVNSLHHQAIDTVPAPLQITGCSSDGIIEAIELPDHPFYCGVQWHPEVLIDRQETARRIFEAFVAACRAEVG